MDKTRKTLSPLPGGVIFDMDGTLLDSERVHIGLIKKVSRQMKKPVDEEFLFTCVGVPDRDNRKAYSSKYGADFPFDEMMGSVMEEQVELANTGGFPLRPGVLSILNKLRSLEIKMAVATSAVTEWTEFKLSTSGIMEYFAALACADEVQNGKPAPDIFLLAAEKLGLEPSQCIGIEDSPAGLEGLKAAGIRSIFVKDLITPPPEILQDVWLSCSSMDEVTGLFQ